MANQLPFEPVNITALKAEFPHVNWNRWKHPDENEIDYLDPHHLATAEEFVRMSTFNRTTPYERIRHPNADIYDVFAPRAPANFRVPRNIEELIAAIYNPVRPYVQRRAVSSDDDDGGEYYDFDDGGDVNVVWAAAVRNPWILASDLQKMRVDNHIKRGRVGRCIKWRCLNSIGSMWSHRLTPFIYENPTISTQMARLGLNSPSQTIRECVAHAITKPPPCVGLVARFVEVSLMHTGIPREIAEIVTALLYNPHMVCAWNYEYVTGC